MRTDRKQWNVELDPEIRQRVQDWITTQTERGLPFKNRNVHEAAFGAFLALNERKQLALVQEAAAKAAAKSSAARRSGLTEDALAGAEAGFKILAKGRKTSAEG